MRTIASSRDWRSELQQIEDLRLHGDVEGSGGLVGDQDVGVVGQGHRDHHSLAHAAGELVRVRPGPAHRVGERHRLQKFHRLRLGLARSDLLMGDHCFGDLPADVEHRVERCHRVLEDHPDAAPTDAAKHRRRCTQKLGPVEADRTGGDRIDIEQPERGQHRRALSRPRFTDHGGHLAAVHGEVEPAHGMHLPTAHGEADVESTDLQQWRPFTPRSTLGPDVERVAQTVAEEVERHADREDRQSQGQRRSTTDRRTGLRR